MRSDKSKNQFVIPEAVAEELEAAVNELAKDFPSYETDNELFISIYVDGDENDIDELMASMVDNPVSCEEDLRQFMSDLKKIGSVAIQPDEDFEFLATGRLSHFVKPTLH